MTSDNHTAPEDEDGYAIPAASIGDIDLAALARVNSYAAQEIARLEDLMNRGEETDEEFCSLCQLLFEVGADTDAEYLLRRNMSYQGAYELYARLFGTTKENEFHAAIEAFKSQFNIPLRFVETNDFLDSTFHSDGVESCSGNLSLMARPCEVRIGYIERDYIEADITLFDPNRYIFECHEYMTMRFINDVWKISDPEVH